MEVASPSPALYSTSTVQYSTSQETGGQRLLEICKLLEGSPEVLFGEFECTVRMQCKRTTVQLTVSTTVDERGRSRKDRVGARRRADARGSRRGGTGSAQ